MRYPAGANIIVFYNPDDPSQAVLERDPPSGAFQFMALLIAALVAGSIVAADGMRWIETALESALPNPKNAPFVIGFSFFAICCALMARAIGKQAETPANAKQGLAILWVCVAAFVAGAVFFATTTGGKI